MRHKRMSIGWLAMAVIVALASLWLTGGGRSEAHADTLTDADWPQLGHDAQRTNATPSTVNGPYRYYWRWTQVPIASRVQPVVSGGRLFVGGANGVMYALDAAYDALGGEPRILWQQDLGSPIRAGAAVDGTTVVVGTHAGAIRGLDAATGQPRWSYVTDGAIVAAPLVADGTAYLGSADGWFYAIDTASGALRWRTQIGVPILGSAALSADGGRVLFVAEDVSAYALSIRDGTVDWQTQLQGQSGSDRWPVVLGDTVVFRTQPLLSRVELLESGDATMDGAGPRVSDWAGDWAAVRPKIVDDLTANPHRQSFFALSASSGTSRGVAPVLYTFGVDEAPSPPAVYNQQLWMPYRARHGIQNDSKVAVHVSSKYDADLGRMDPATLDIAGLSSSDTFNYQFRLTSDEPAVVTIAGDLLLVDSWDRLGGVHLSSGTLEGIAQVARQDLPCGSVSSNNSLPPFFESCPLIGPQNGEGRSRAGAVVASGRVFWHASGQTKSEGLGAIGPADGRATLRQPTATPTAATSLPGPIAVSDGALASIVWAEPQRPVSAPADLTARLEEEITKVVASDEHLMPFYLSRGDHGPGSYPPDVGNDTEPAKVADSQVYWYDPGELVLSLSLAYPYLNPTLQARTKAYLQSEMNRFPPLQNLPWPVDSWLKQGRAREPYPVPTAIRRNLSAWPPPGVPIQTLYALWVYGKSTGDWSYLSARWPAIQSLYNTKKGSVNSYAEISGLIGYARIAKQLGHEVEAANGEAAALAAMRTGQNFAQWRDQANAMYPQQQSYAWEQPGRRAPVFFGMTPEVGEYLRASNLPAVQYTLDDVAGYPNGAYLWYATRLGLLSEVAESSYHSPEIAWSVFLTQAYVREERQEQLRQWLDRPWGIGDPWYLQKLVATIEAPAELPYVIELTVTK